MPAKIIWTVAMDDKLCELAKKTTIIGCVRGMGLNYDLVRRRLRKLGVTPLKRRQVSAPPKELWFATVRQHALKAKLKPSEAACARYKAAVRVRWAAFESILASNPEYSIAGLARVAGFDHTAIHHGLARRKGATVKAIQGGASIATKRREMARAA